MADYKQICLNLVAAIEAEAKERTIGFELHKGYIEANDALAEPEPEVPTRRQLMMLADDMEMASVDDAAKYARVVLARWGNNTSRIN